MKWERSLTLQLLRYIADCNYLQERRVDKEENVGGRNCVGGDVAKAEQALDGEGIVGSVPNAPADAVTVADE